MLEEIKKSMLLLGFTEDDKLDMRELRRIFKRKSLAMLPERHPTVPNAHSRFEELISAFVQVIVIQSSNTSNSSSITRYINYCQSDMRLVYEDKVEARWS